MFAQRNATYWRIIIMKEPTVGLSPVLVESYRDNLPAEAEHGRIFPGEQVVGPYNETGPLDLMEMTRSTVVDLETASLTLIAMMATMIALGVILIIGLVYLVITKPYETVMFSCYALIVAILTIIFRKQSRIAQ